MSETKQMPRFIEDADFDACVEDYISDEEKTAEKPVPLEMRMKFLWATPGG
ncbi:hypothetical protein A2U01_0098945, partial [Trifolium medium]|nr:hypothetical protein [Trifolium medium]